ncbi:stalk domain-containing protein [Cohnella sp. GbtcB17]|uniref:stalk domain-containing protein n=1 Tax=Cohnella sp. GbtcB17 TaxID=2824762 RepID=UPI001C2FD2DD|nr:stalk domain-containing protein [Cohnella sp. GbtcB17]
MRSMKNGWTAFCAIAIVCVFFLMAEPRSASADSAPAGAAYLVDEDFAFLSNLVPGESQPSGWDIRAAGGALTSIYNNTLKISDASTRLPVSMSRKFPAQSEGTLTMEFRFKPFSVINGLHWQLLGGDTPGVSIATSASGSNLLLETSGGGTVTLQAYSANVEYGVKVIANLSTQKTDVYVNGILRASAQNFANTVSSLNRFQLTTGVASTGDFFFTPLHIYKGYAVNERLLSVMPASGNLPQDWTAVLNGGSIKVAEMLSAPKPDVNSLKIDASASTGSMTLAKSFAAISGDLTAEYKIFIPAKTDGLAAELRSGSTTAIKLFTSNGKLSYEAAAGTPVELYDYKANLWYRLKVVLKPASHKADLYINGKLQAADVNIAAGIASVDGIRFSTSAANKGLMWLDDILVYANTPEPADYVPAPAAVSTGSQLVGVQSCPMWREGHHLGWDVINPFPDRTPYLGFYDEGNPETADWEIKWMLEHGIDFQMSCWFRPIGGEGAPIKDSYLSDALDDGYFNAKYSNLAHFAIMWENLNSAAKDIADFRDNLVPYWIEYYFKDPRYLKVDSKPVFTIYNYDQFVKLAGGTKELAKDLMDDLRDAARDAGVGELTILNVYNGTSAQDLQNRKAAGFDGVYAYSWGSFGGHPEFQKLKLTLENNAGVLDVIPGLSMGRDDTAWGLSSGYYATPAEFKSLAQWTKDTYIPSLSAGNLGKKLVMLDNWNEYGEGHFIMPAGLAGFGYVDAIRDVFAGVSTHTDTVPTATQKARINVLYPEGRVVQNRTLTPPAISSNSVAAWEFNTPGDSEGWSVLKQIDAVSVADGTFTGTTNNTDPGIISADHLGIKAEDAPYLKIRMKNSANDIDGRVFFTTELDGDWNETKAMGFYVIPQDNGYTDYYVEMWRNKSWTGNIRQIRIDPISAIGTISIDYIRAVADDSTDIKLYIDGKRKNFSQPALVQDGAVMVPIKDIWLQLGVRSEWDAANQKFIAVKSGSVYELTVGSTTALKDNQSITLEHAPTKLTNGTVLAPLSYLKQAFGATVKWDTSAQKIQIYPSGVVWDFEFGDGWTANGSISGGQALGGRFSGTSLGVSGGVEPAVESPDQLGLDASTIKRVRVQLGNQTTGSQAKLYYTTDADPVWNAAKSFSTYILPSDSTLREYVFDTTTAAAWTGTIKQIRVVPTLSAGSFSIDSVQLDTATSLPTLGANLVADPGMEGSTIQARVQNGALGLDVTQSHSGHQSLKVVKDSRYGSASFPIAVTQGQEYHYSVWAKLAKAPTLTEPLRLCLQYTVDGNVKQMIIYTSVGLSADQWTQLQGNYTIAETSPISNVLLYFYTEIDGTNHDYYLDDVEARLVTYSSSPTWTYATGLSINPTTTMNMGETKALVPMFQPSSSVNNQALIWNSDNPDVAVVDISGTVFAKKTGIANITAKAIDGGFTATTAVTVALGSGQPAGAVLGSNLILNPDMEGAAIPTAYYGSSAGVALTTSEHRLGTQSLQVAKLNNNKYASFFMPTLIEQGKTYYYSAWAKLDAAPAQPALFRICLQYKLDGVAQQKILFTSAPLLRGGWTQASGFYKIEETGVVTDVRVFLYTEQSGPVQTFYVDDVEVRPVIADSSPPVTTAALNPSAPDGPGGAYNGPVTLTLAAADSVSSVAQTVYSVDNGTTWSPYTAPLAFGKQGSYTILYKSTDLAGNAETQQSVSFSLAATVTTVSLQDSAGQPLSGGTVKYYDGSWKDLGTTDASGQATKALPERSYIFSVTYLGTSKQLTQNTATDPAIVVFQTVKAKVQLKESQGNPLNGADAKVYAGGSWQTMGTTAGGETTKELLPGTYTFGITYDGVYKEKSQNVGDDPAVVFQTASVLIQLKDAGGNPVNGGTAKVYAGGSWRTIGSTAGGEIRVELLPGSYTFGMTYGTVLANIVKDIGTDPTVVFQLP